MIAHSFYCSKASYALPLIAPMSRNAMDEWEKLMRITVKQTYALCEKTQNDKLYKATMEPSPQMVLRERLLKVQGKLARFQTELHPAAKKFLAET